MSELINTLTEGHKNIFISLDKLKNLEIGSREWKDSLTISKTILLTHLRKEDDALCPALNKIAENNNQLRTILDIYADEMKDISLQTVGFFNKYIGADNLSQFSNDLDDLYAKLHSRTIKEEEVLYPHYKELSAE